MVMSSGTFFVPHEMKSAWIYIHSYDEKCLRGYFSSAFYPRKFYFSNMTQFLFLFETLLDELDYPQRGTVQRLFNTEKKPLRLEDYAREEINEPAPLARFQISVLFRQNASWQGVLLWLEEKQEVNFRSVLELIGLIDNALT